MESMILSIKISKYYGPIIWNLYFAFSSAAPGMNKQLPWESEWIRNTLLWFCYPYICYHSCINRPLWFPLTWDSRDSIFSNFLLYHRWCVGVVYYTNTTNRTSTLLPLDVLVTAPENLTCHALNYLFTGYTRACLWWDTERKTWVGDGCQVIQAIHSLGAKCTRFCFRRNNERKNWVENPF